MVLDENNKKEALKKLTKEEYDVTQNAATEYPFTGKYDDFYERAFTLMWCQVSRCFLARISMMRDAAGLVLLSRLRN